MVVYHCCVPNCTASTRKFNKLHKYPWMQGVTFISLPNKTRNAKERRDWLRLIRRPNDWTPTKYTRICSLHFDENNNNTLPTLFPYNNFKKPLSERKTSNSTQVGTDNNLESQYMHVTLIIIMDPSLRAKLSFRLYLMFVEKLRSLAQKSQRYVSKLNYPTHKPTKDHDYSYHRDDKVLVDSSTQTEVTANDIRLLEQENDRLKHTLEDKESLSREIFVKHVTKDDKHVKFYTGVQNFAILMGIFQLLITKCSKLKYWSGKGSVNDKNYQTGNKLKPGPQRKLTDFQEFILTLVRLRLGLIDYHLADIFGISKTRVSQIFTTWITFMSGLFGKLIKWPSKQQVRKHMPHSFKMLYPKTRCIIDCTEFFFQHPRSPTAQASTYSTYKSKNTGKCLLGISPSGTFTFVSDVYGGNVSDRFITEKSGFMDYIEEGDDIMADRGFTIRDLLTEKKATLNMPPFTRKCVWGKKKRLNVNEIKQTRSIAKLRIHVERAIQRLKLFKLIGNTIAWSLKPLTNQMVKVSAFLCNLMPKLVRR
ncbi:unnamed protein product [Mytilus edulis]|uniref:THAP-type domain-containing protein n=1 Tax=Mytilus edulis TaxID=6550 RepID=A0A8S3Q1Y2_MYTED|nr:unnamed protein product [Mytilus edulis]